MFKNIIESYKNQRKENKKKELLEENKDHFNSLELFSKSISELRLFNLKDFVKKFHNFEYISSLICNIEDEYYKKKILKSLIFYYLENNLTFALVDNSNLLNDEDIEELKLCAEKNHYIPKIKFSLFDSINDLYTTSFILKLENQNRELFSKCFLKDLSEYIPFKKEIKILITDIINLKRTSEDYSFSNFVRTSRKNGIRLICFYDSKISDKDEFYFCNDFFGNKLTHIREGIISENYDIKDNLNLNMKSIREPHFITLNSFIREKYHRKIDSSKVLEEMHEEYFLELEAIIEGLNIESGFILESFFMNDGFDFSYADVEYKKYFYERNIVRLDI